MKVNLEHMKYKHHKLKDYKIFHCKVLLVKTYQWGLKFKVAP